MPSKVIIGVYLSWRGDLISQYWPVSRQLTYWNREATAIRVGNTSLTEALIEISDATKSNCRSCIVVFAGHSFGALALERAISQAMITRLEQAWMEAREPNNSFPSGRIPVKSLANLIIYVNSAAAASESKQMMDYLASSRYIYQPGDSDNEIKNKDIQKLNQPLILSVTSEADLATGLALKIGHAVPLLGFKWNGSLRPKGTEAASGQPTSEYSHACFDPLRNEKTQSIRRFDLSQSDYYMSTAAHLQPLWSHQVVSEKTANSVIDPTCEPSEEDPSIYMTCKMANFKYTVKAVPNRCNGTPYWVIQVPKEIVPDHGTIFTQRLLAFLVPFIQYTPPESRLTRPATAEEERPQAR